MGRRSNSGYIGRDFELDTKGIIDQNKRNLTRFLNDNLTYTDPSQLYVGSALPTGSTYYLGTSGFGSGSVVSSSLVSGTLANVALYAGGTGYGTNVTLSFSDGGGTGADGYVVTLSAGVVATVDRLGYIIGAIITDPGEGYTSAPTVTFSAPINTNGKTGVTAIGTASISNGAVTNITITTTGSNYRTGGNFPTITFSGGGSPTRTAAAVPILEFGRNYTSDPTVTVTGAGSGAVVSASIFAQLAPTASITTAGGGYSQAPTIQVIPAVAEISSSSTLSGTSLGTVSTSTISTASFHYPPDVTVGGELSYPTLSNNQIYGTYAIYNNNSNWVAFNVTTNGGGGYTVDWGDGTSNNYNSNVTASHQYTTSSFNALSSSLYNGGFKTAQIKVTLSGSATSLATVNLTTRPTPTTGSFSTSATTTNHWLSIVAAGTNISSFTVGSGTAGATTCAKLQRFYFSGSNQITSFTSMFYNCYDLREVTELFMGSGTDYSTMFLNCYNLTKIPTINLNNTLTGVTSMFVDCRKLESINFVSASNTTSWNSTFANAYQLKTITGANFSTPTVTNYQTTFQNCYNLLELPPINVTNVTTLSSTFSGCFKLSSIKFIGTTRNVTIFAGTFQNCTNLVDIPKDFLCNSATSLSNMFFNCRLLREAPRFYNTTSVTSVNSLFSGCTSLKKVHLFDTRAVTDFSSMFASCTTLKVVPLFNMRSATSISQMFSGCSVLESIPLFNTANIATFTSVFASCISLKTIPPLNTTKGTSFVSMFNGCSSLVTIPYIDTQNGTSFSNMFTSCTALVSVPTLNTSNATTLANMFSGCTLLRNVPNFNIPNCTDLSGMFLNCSSLIEGPIFYNANKVTTISTTYFACISLTKVPGMNGTALTNISQTFQNCNNLIEIGPIPTSGITTATTPFSSCVSLKRNNITNINLTVDMSNQSLDSVALNEIYTNLSATGTGKTITVTGNWGTPNDNPAIATAKGWTVTG